MRSHRPRACSSSSDPSVWRTASWGLHQPRRLHGRSVNAHGCTDTRSGGLCPGWVSGSASRRSGSSSRCGRSRSSPRSRSRSTPPSCAAFAPGSAGRTSVWRRPRLRSHRCRHSRRRRCHERPDRDVPELRSATCVGKMTPTLPAPLARLGAWMDGRLERIQATSLGGRLDPYLGLGELRRFNPLLALIPMVVLFLLGLRRSQFGHMDTVGGIFPMMALISGLNPVTGLLSALAYGAGDLLQKFVVDDVFYEGVKTTGDYWGARLGYLIAYSSLVTFGVLPGVCSRAGRKIAVRVAAGERGGTSGGLPSPPVAASAAAAAIIGSVLGGGA